MDLERLDQLGRVEKEIELSKDWKVTLHTLTVIEQQKALKEVPEDVDEDAAKFTYLQTAILVQATDKINGVPVEEKKVREIYQKMQYNIAAKLFAKYLEMTAEQTKVIDELKKN